MARKYHPGHYVQLKRIADTQKDMAKYVGMKGVAGIVKRYAWRELEPIKGVYKLEALKSDVLWAHAHGTRLIAMFEDKTFVRDNPMPEYLAHISVDNSYPNGYTALRWRAEYVNRCKLLLTEIGNAVDSNPAFEGIMLLESSLSLDRVSLDDHEYDPILYRESYKKIIAHAATALPTSRFFFNQNFFARGNKYIDEILQFIVDGRYGTSQGGPDLLQENAALLQFAYPRYRMFKDRIPAFIIMSWPTFTEWSDELQRRHTLKEQNDYAHQQLFCDHIIWYPRLEYLVEMQKIWAASVPVADEEEEEDEE